MTVRFYQFGEAVGSSGSEAPLASNYGPEQSFRGSTGAGIVTLTFTNSTKSITIRNTDDSDGLQFSLDNATWHDLGAYAAIPVNANVSNLRLRGNGGAD